MSLDDSISRMIGEVKNGNRDAAEAIWDRYFPQLVRIAREKLAGQRGRMADEEDVALSVLNSFLQAAERGRFPDLTDRDGLWRLLSRMTFRKAVDLIRYNEREKRQVLGESAIAGPKSESSGHGFSQISDQAIGPELARVLAEDCQRLLDLLEPDLQALALKKLEGYTNKEIAKQRQCSVTTVERRLQLIRKKLEAELRP